MNKKQIIFIVDYLKDKTTVSESELDNYLNVLFPDSKDKSHYFILMKLYQNNIIYKYNTDLFKPCNGRLGYKCLVIFDDDVEEKIESIHPSILVSGWSINEISKYMSLQLFNNLYFVETYSYARESVLNTLLDNGLNAIYEEDYQINSKYIRNDATYIIRTINEDSPVVKPPRNVSKEEKTFITSPKLEKIIVDIIIDKFFDTLLGDERINILKALLSKYQVNMATISRYAKKRYKYDKVMSYIEQTGFNIENGEFA